MKYPTEVLMLAALLFAPAAQATSILIYKAPESPHDLRSEPTVDPARRNGGGRDPDQPISGRRLLAPESRHQGHAGPTYDPPLSKEIRYHDTVCARVEEHSFLITDWPFVDPTAHCSFEERRREGVGGEAGSYPMTEVYFVIQDGG